MAVEEAARGLLEAAQALRPRILAERERIEAGRRLPEDLTRELAGTRFFRIFLPAAYGGLDLTSMDAMEVFEELARADASVAWCVWNGNVHWTTVQLSRDVAEEIFADPSMILANSTRPTGASTQNQALTALLFLYRDVLELEVPGSMISCARSTPCDSRWSSPGKRSGWFSSG